MDRIIHNLNRDIGCDNRGDGKNCICIKYGWMWLLDMLYIRIYLNIKLHVKLKSVSYSYKGSSIWTLGSGYVGKTTIIRRQPGHNRITTTA